MIGYMDHVFPDGDYETVEEYMPDELFIADRFFSQSMDRLQKFSIVLPPGYHDPDNADKTYPVVYLAHGYGQEPEDNAPAMVIVMPLMARGDLQKMIVAFPDGKCATPNQCADDCRDATCLGLIGDARAQCHQDCNDQCADTHRECVQGNFYSNLRATWDHPARWTEGEQKFGQIEDSFWDLRAYLSENYRVREPEVFEVDTVTGQWVY